MSFANAVNVRRAALCAILFIVPVFTLGTGADFYDLPKLFILCAFLLFPLCLSLRRAGSLSGVSVFHLPLSIFLLSSALSFCFSVSPSLSLMGTYTGKEGIVVTLVFYLFYFLFVHSVPQKSLFTAFFAAWLALIFVSVLALLQYAGIALPFFIEPLEKFSRPQSTIGTPTQLGGYMAVALSFFILAFSGMDKRKERIFSFASPLCALALFLTISRGAAAAFLASCVGMGLMTVLSKKGVFRQKSPAGLAFIFLLLISLFSAFPFKINLYYRTQSTLLNRLRGTDLQDFTIRERISMWESALGMIKDYPAAGVGVDAVPAIFQKYQKPPFMKMEGRYASTAKVHNQFLQVAATQGLTGLFAWLWLVLCFYIRAFTLFRSERAGNGERFFLLASTGSITAWLVQGCFTLNTVSSNLLFWFNLAVVDVLSRGTGIAGGDPSEHKSALKTSLLPALSFARALFFLPFFAVILCFAGDFYFKKGVESLNRQSPAVSERYLKKAAGLNPFEGLHHFFLGASYVKMNRIQDAFYEYGYAARAFPHDPRILTIWAVVCEGAGRKEEAFSLYHEAYALCRKMGCDSVKTDFFDILVKKVGGKSL